MAEQNICTFKDPNDDKYSCNHSVHDEKNKLCIFHCKEKDKQNMQNIFKGLVEHNDSFKDYRYFIFPDDFEAKFGRFRFTCNFNYAKFGDNNNFENISFDRGCEFKSTSFGHDD